MILEHAELTTAPGAGPGLDAELPALRAALLAAPGCRSVELLRSVDQPDTRLLVVAWEQLTDHTERFPTTPQADLVRAVLVRHCAVPPRVVHYAAAGSVATPQD